MSSLMTESLLDKATLTITKLKGTSTIMCIVLNHTWRYVEGPYAAEPSEKVLTSAGVSIDPSKLNPSNPDHYEDNPTYDTWVIETWNACCHILLAVSDEVKGELLLCLESPAVDIMMHLLLNRARDMMGRVNNCIVSHRSKP